MKEHQQSGKVNCPKCGADECFRRPGEFRCGSGNCVDADDFDQSDICKELCQLRSKLTPEGAEPLVWEEQNLKNGGKSIITESCFGWMRVSYSDDQAILIVKERGQGAVLHRHFTLDAAKAHAKELHQAAYAEFRRKWDRKVGAE